MKKAPILSLLWALLLMPPLAQLPGAVGSAWAASGSGSEGSIDDLVDAQAEEDALDAAEEAAEAAAEEAARQAEEAAEEAARQAEDAAEEAAKAAEDAAEEAAKAAEDAAEEAAKAAEDAAEDAANVAEDAADAAADQADDAADQAEDAAEDSAEQAEEAAEESAEAAEDAADESADQAEDAADDSADAAEDAADDSADEAEDAADDSEDAAGDSDDDDAGGSGDEDDDGAEAEDGDDSDSHSGKGGKHEESGHGGRAGAATEAERPAERFAGLGQDRDGNEISVGEWLVIASPDEVAALEKLGYITRGLERLEGLGRVIARMEAPANFDFEQARAAVHGIAPDAEVDYNHVYRAETSGTSPAPAADAGAPRTLLPALAAVSGRELRIGVIDTAADTGHPALGGARIETRDFVPYDAPRPRGHGTSVVSILAGNAPGYTGLLPEAAIYLAAVFFTTPQGQQTATTVSLVRALDWMAANAVPVVNMSLAGPRNDVLAMAIARARERGTLVVAAVGNRGPAARPLYPAAYDDVVAVTAVNSRHRVYRLANQGEQVDFAAPGVGVRHAVAGAGYGDSSGTSMAAPFVTAVIASSCPERSAFGACLRALEARADDIGGAGFDTVYGHGFIRPLASP